jgi:Cu+-exporting ATPase
VVESTLTDEALRLAAAVERKSEHPLGSALVEFAASRAIAPPEASDFRATPGRGVEARVEGRTVVIGNPTFLRDRGIPTDEEGILVAIDGRFAGSFTVSDPIRAGAADAIAEMRRLSLNVILLSGDRERNVQAIARAAGIERVVAEVLPDGKVTEIRRLQGEGRVVAMAGDGINDAPALAQADVGFAMGSGTDIAIEAGDVTLLRADLMGIPRAIALSRAAWNIIRQNLFWALAYNVVAIPAAALGYLSPVIASAAMAASSVTVVLNSLRLRTR